MTPLSLVGMSTLRSLRRLPTLPLEIVALIIISGLPFKRFASFRERYCVLLAYSLVSHAWRELAQARLFRHVWLATQEHAHRFVRALELTGRGPGVRSVRFGSSRWASWLVSTNTQSQLSHESSAVVQEVL